MPQGGLNMLEINQIPECFIRDLPIEAEVASYRTRLERASKAFTELICEYRSGKEIPRTLIESISNILGGNEKC